MLMILSGAIHSAPVSSGSDTGPSLVEVPTGQRFSMGTFDLVLGRTHEQRGIVWIDDHRVMFKGTRNSRRSDRTDQGIFIWDTRENVVTRYGGEQYFCYSDGWIYLWNDHGIGQGDTSSMAYRYGPLGREEAGLCVRKASEYRDCIRELDMSCKRVPETSLPHPFDSDGRLILRLRDGDGVLAVRSSMRALRSGTSEKERIAKSRSPVLLVNEQYPAGKQLPIQEVEEVGVPVAAFSEYAKAYVLIPAKPKDSPPGLFSNWPAGESQPIYLMKRDGEVTITEIPKRAEWTGVFQAMPTRKGMVFKGVHGRTGGGLFQLVGGDIKALDSGQVGTLTVSSDGCKVAFSIVNDYGKTRENSYRLKYVDLCLRG